MTTDLTDRYVGATLRSIPENQRADIEAELRASIGDAIEARIAGGENTETAERAVLDDLGDPDRLAAGYTGQPGYLIGPEHFFDYKRILGVLLLTVPIVMVFVGAAELIAGGDVGSLFAETIGIGFTLVLHIVFWTTLVFALIERSDEKRPAGKWSLDRLPALPHASSVKLGETIGTVVFLVLTIAAILFSRDVSPVRGDDGTPIPFFDPALWEFWFPFLLVVLTLEIVFEFAKYRVGRWTSKLASINVGLNAGFAIPAIYLLTTERMFNPDFFEEIGWGPERAGDETLVLVSSIVVAMIALWDIVDGFRKARK